MGTFRKLALLFIVSLILPATIYAGGKWYNYYEDGQKYMKMGSWERAIDEFRSAASLEFKDKPQFRMYGMHFMDYFPHREMGICYYNLGDVTNAKKSLELSMAFAPSKRAKEYLDKISKGDAPSPSSVSPSVTVDREEEKRLAREREQIEREKKRLAEQAAALERQKKEADEATSKKVALEERRIAEEREKLAKLEAEKTASKTSEVGTLPVGALTYDPTRVTQVGSRLSIAVLPFENKGGDANISSTVQDKMITSLYSLKRFKIIERSQIDKVMSEQKLGLTGAIDPDKAVKVGKMIGVDAILIGSISSTDNGVGMDARLIDTESGVIITAKDAYSPKNSLQDVKNMATDISIQVYNDVPLVEGYVIKADVPNIVLDVGSAKGMRKGMKMVVYKEGEAITHPVTGEILGKQVTKLGELLLTEVQAKMSEAQVVEKEQGQTFAIGNKVVAK
jgi:TolB-like protein